MHPVIVCREWEKELYIWRSGGYPSLYKALFRCFASRVIAVGFAFLFQVGSKL